MKKVLFILLASMLCVSVQARSHEPQYKIISNSYSDEDIQNMYQTKESLLKDYKEWVKGVYDKNQVLIDHQKDYQAQYNNGIYQIILGEGKGKELTGELKASYCESTKDIQSKSILFDWLF